MSTTTTNLQLKKPAMTDLVSTTITDLGNNFDIIDASLAEKANQSDLNTTNSTKADKTYVDTQLSTKRDKSSLLSMSDMGQDVKTAMTGGSVAVVGNEGVINTNIVDGSVNAAKTDFLQDTLGNLIDLTTVTTGYYINQVDGTLVANASYAVSDYIKVQSNTPYYASDPRLSAWYDKDKKFISGLANGYTVPQTSPSNARYIRITFLLSSYQNQYFGTNSTWISATGKQEKLQPSTMMSDMIKRTMKGEKVSIDSIFGITSNFKNLINPYELQANTAIDPYTGFTYSATNMYATGYIPVIAGQTYSSTHTYHSAVYDKDKKFISGLPSGTWTNPLTIPNGAVFIRLSVLSGDVFSSGSSLLSSVGYGDGSITIDAGLKSALSQALGIGSGSSNGSGTNQSKLYGKKIAVLGDSITGTDYTTPTWWQLIAQQTGCVVSNYGVSGTTIAYNADRETTYGQCFAERYSNMIPDADIVYVMGGTNDAGRTQLGDWHDTVNTTLYGALNIILQGLKTNYPDKTILFATPIQSQPDWNNGYNNYPINTFFNTVTATSTMSIQMVAEAIKAKCRQYGVKCLNLFDESGISGYTTSDYRNGDTLHPSTIGQEKMRKAIQNYWETSI